ncbi:putative integral membrane protein (apicoplast) [Theileria parva strain Muguga]|uniref:Uncharacterized protein n=1 Tax=Theileria parva TaxID=5875 RepID=Q4MY83_THEPA|nr:putative integral membrane protein [Theileria parva strain Muguga]|eukprot:XP_762709.1 hypothetical protein (apicoplast) [Theileria parva strain Muguga]
MGNKLTNFFYIISSYIRYIFSYSRYILFTLNMYYLEKATVSLFGEPTFKRLEKFVSLLLLSVKFIGLFRLLICILKLL